MRILHTSDWHVGKRLGRHDRMADHRAVLDEIVDVAEREAVDLVLVAGDLFERPAPGVDALRLVLDALARLATGRPVVAIAGNHDSPALFELLAPLLEPLGIYLVGAIRPPAEGGVLELEAGGERALVACFPFLRAGLAIDFMRDVDGWHRAYADRLGLLVRAYCDRLETDGADAVKLLMGHFPIHGVRLGSGRGDGPAGARGERMLHLGESYSAAQEAILPGPSYVALGHIHTPQDAPGCRVAARYAGSPLELDFGEAGEAKQVVLIEVEPGGVARCRERRLTAGRRLVRARGPFAELVARPELAASYLDLVVETEGPDPGLADRARAAFPYLVKVRAEYPRDRRERPVRAGTSWDRLYLDYYRKLHQTEPDPALLAAFREVLGEVLGEAAERADAAS